MSELHKSLTGPVKLLLTVPEAAKALAISPRKLWELTNRNVIPSVRIGRLIRYPLADLQAWVTQQAEATKGGDQ